MDTNNSAAGPVETNLVPLSDAEAKFLLQILSISAQKGVFTLENFGAIYNMYLRLRHIAGE